MIKINNMGEEGPQVEQKTSEQIVTEILANKRELTPDQVAVIAQMLNTGKKDEGEKWVSPSHYLLEYGGKYLILSFRPDRDEVGTYLKNNGKEKKPQETTLLYTAAKKMIQQRADESGRQFIYILTTTSPVMKKWAAGRGSEIFDWDPEPGYKQPASGTTKYWFSRKFFPQKDSGGKKI